MLKEKLFQHAPEGTATYKLLGSDGIPDTRPAAGLPLPLWPDGHWCAEVAMFLRKFADANLSLFDRGGTLGTYASQISHLVRFCWRKGLPFHRLTDDFFAEFIGELVDETVYKNGVWELARSGRTVVCIGRLTLDFLVHIGNLHRIDSFVSEDGCIRAIKKTYVCKAKPGRRRRTVRYWHHNCFPPLSPKHERHLIGQEYINRLRRAAVTLSASPFLRQRRLVVLRLLEATGARRSEIVGLTVASVLNAISMNQPFLTLPTSKKGANASGEQKFRVVPIEHHELELISDYIEYHRSGVIEKCLGKENDHGILLVSHNTGKPLTPGTITLELSYLRAEAGIKGKAHPHLFRHRFITYSLLKLIRAHNLKDKGQFEMKFRLEGFKKEVAELTGQSHIESLDPYIDWAFIELYGYDDSAREAVDAASLAASIRSSIAELEKLKDVLSADEFSRNVISRMTAIVKDLDGRVNHVKNTEALD